MHRVEAENATETNLFTDSPPPTRLEAAWFNTVQEEICYCIEQAGLTVLNEDNDTREQLKSAIEVLSTAAGGVPSGTIMWIYADSAPSGWTLSGVPSDELLAIKGGATYTTGGAQAGTWTQPNHTHGVGSYAGPSHTHAAGTLAGPSHTHGAGTLAGPSHTHGVGTYAGPSHNHAAGTLAGPSHSHASGTLTIPNHQHALTSGSFPNHIHELANGQVHSGYTLNSAGNVKDTVTGELRGLGSPGADNYYNADYTTNSDGGGSLTGNTPSDGGGGGASGSTASDGTGSVTGSTASDGTGSVTGSSAADGTSSVTGSTASDGTGSVTGSTASDGTGSITGTSDNGATANTYRPLARVGILCSKD